MAVSGSTSLDFTRDQMITMAFRLCALNEASQDVNAADLSLASDFMNLEMMTLQAEGIILRTIERTTLTLVSGTASYTLASDTIDVDVGPNGQAGTIVPTSGAETLVTAMSRNEYMDLSDKSSGVTGRPTMVYIEKLASVSVTFWPVPDSTAVSYRYSRVRLLNDMTTGGVTADLARRWLQAIVYATAVQVALAKGIALERVSFLRSEAERLKAICRADDNQRGPIRFSLRHNGRRW